MRQIINLFAGIASSMAVASYASAAHLSRPRIARQEPDIPEPLLADDIRLARRAVE